MRPSRVSRLLAVLSAILALAACGEGDAPGARGADSPDAPGEAGSTPGRAAPVVMLFRTAGGWRLEVQPPPGTSPPAALEVQDGSGRPIASGPGTERLSTEIPAGVPTPFNCRARWPDGVTTERVIAP